MMSIFIVVAGFVLVVAVFVIRYERSGNKRKKISGRGGDFEA